MRKSAFTLLAVFAVLSAGGYVFSQTRTGGGSSTTSTSSGSASGFGSGSGQGFGTGKTGPWRDPSKEVFALIYSPGDSWVRSKSVYEQNLNDHGRYMSSLLQANVLLLGGPFKDNTGGMAVIQVNNEQEALSVAANDPAVVSRVFNVVVRPWHIVFEKGAGAAVVGTGGVRLPGKGGTAAGSAGGGGG